MPPLSFGHPKGLLEPIMRCCEHTQPKQTLHVADMSALHTKQVFFCHHSQWPTWQSKVTICGSEKRCVTSSPASAAAANAVN